MPDVPASADAADLATALVTFMMIGLQPYLRVLDRNDVGGYTISGAALEFFHCRQCQRCSALTWMKARRFSFAVARHASMRILHIIRSVDPRGGGPIEGIIQQNYSMGSTSVREIVSLDPPDAPFLGAVPATVHALGVTPYANLGKSKIAGFGYSPQFVPWLKSNIDAYDCAIVNGLWNYSAVGSSRVLPGGRVPYFVFSHGMMDPWFRKAYPIKHHLKQASWLLFEGRLAAGAEAVLFTTAEERRLAAGEFRGHIYNADVVRYGTAAATKDDGRQRAAFERACPTVAGRPYLLFLSRIHPKKGCDLLVKAFGQVADEAPDLHLVIAGPDETGWEDELKDLAASAGVTHRIHWPGMLTGDAKWGAFRGAEAFILPSHQENFGIVVAESLACGTPVLLSDKVNTWREVVDGQAGYVTPDDEVGTVRLIRTWLQTPSPARAQMRCNAERVFEASFEIGAAAGDMFAKIEHAVKRSEAAVAAKRGDASPSVL